MTSWLACACRLYTPIGYQTARWASAMDQHAHSHGSHDRRSPEHRGQAEASGTIDPVCGMSVDPHTTPHRHTHQGHPYYFCSADCRSKFAADPARYVSAGAASAPPVPAGAIYTCPMHPEIRQPGPGACPICGMALEPELVSADSAPNPELADMTRRFWVGLVLSLPVVALEMGGHLVDLHGVISQSTVEHAAVHLCDASGAVGRLAVLRARLAVAGHTQPQHVHADRHGDWRRVSLQRGCDAGARAVSTCFRGHDGAVAVYFEAAAVITVLVLLGQVLELRAREQTSGAIRALLDLAPKVARRVKEDGSDEEIALEHSLLATGCGCGRARKCRSMGCSLRAAPRSMSRWSQASRCRPPRRPAPR